MNQHHQILERWIGAISVGGKCAFSKTHNFSIENKLKEQENVIYIHFWVHDVSDFVSFFYMVQSFSSSLPSSLYGKFRAYLYSHMSTLLFFVQVIHQGHVEIQVCPLTGPGRRVIFGSAARCTSAVPQAMCFSAPRRGCAYPMAPGLELSLPANVSRLHLECTICKLHYFTCLTKSF